MSFIQKNTKPLDRIARQRARELWESPHINHRMKQLLRYRGFLENETESVHNVRQAKVIAYILEHYPVEIGNRNIIVGRYTTQALTGEEERELKPSGEYFRKHHGRLRYGPGSGGTGGHHRDVSL
jgi:hypothetical protein